jgi:hypothetical protein
MAPPSAPVDPLDDVPAVLWHPLPVAAGPPPRLRAWLSPPASGRGSLLSHTGGRGSLLPRVDGRCLRQRPQLRPPTGVCGSLWWPPIMYPRLSWCCCHENLQRRYCGSGWLWLKMATGMTPADTGFLCPRPPPRSHAHARALHPPRAGHHARTHYPRAFRARGHTRAR